MTEGHRNLPQSIDIIERNLLLAVGGNDSTEEEQSQSTCGGSVKISEAQICVQEICNALSKGDFTNILKHQKVQEILGNCSDIDNLEEVIRIHLRELSKADDGSGSIYWCHLLVQLIAVSLLLIFIQLNWINMNAIKYDAQLVPFYHIDKEEISSRLAVEEATVYNLVKSPELLLISKVILHELCEQKTRLKTIHWWLFRVYSIHEVILDEKSPLLFRKISSMIKYLSSDSYVMDNEDWKLRITFNLEAAHIMLHFYEMGEALKHMEKVKQISGLNIVLTGALGRRTHFQHKAVSQLIVIPEEDKTVKRDRTDDVTYNPSILPKNIELNHETLLNNVEFLNIGDKPSVELYPEEQAALLLQCLYVQQSNPLHDLVNEEMMPYIQHVLTQPKVWSVHRKCLVMRSKLENSKSKTIERAMMQMEEIVNDYRKSDSTFNLSKFQLFFAVKPFTQWEVESQLAKLLISLGVIKNALEVFTRLEMWDEMIVCYHMLQRKDKAEKLIREMLVKNETVKLLCLLGDATDDIQHYQKAYELSGQRSARAKRSIGNHYYQKRKYEEALPHLLQSVEINYLQPEIWFSVAFCADHVGNHELAAKAYRRCVCIEPESYEAWNNLSNSYIQLKDYAKAFSSLHEAIKLSYDNWHIWENLMVVAADCGEFNDVIKACHRLLDLKEKHVDTEVLQILVRAITENLPGARGKPSKCFADAAIKLFGRITSIVTSNADVWDLYGQLCSSSLNKSVEQLEKILHHRQKAHRCLIHDLNWHKDKAQCIKVMKQALVLCDSYHTVSNAHNGSIQTLSSCKLMLKGIVTTVEKKVADGLDRADGDIVNNLKSVKERLTTTLAAIEALQKA